MQDRCAREAPIYAPTPPAEPTLDADTAEVRTVAALLRARYAAGACALSTAALAAELGCNRRTIERAHVAIRETYGARFLEDEIRTGRGDRVLLGKARRILPPAYTHRGVPADSRSPFFAGIAVLIRIGRIELKAKAEAAAAPAFRGVPSHGKPRTRKPARSPSPPATRLPPLGLEDGVPAAIAERYRHHAAGDGWPGLSRVLREARYHARPDEARLAARAVAGRPARRCAAAYFRSLFDRACAGEIVVDPVEVARVRDAERAAEREIDPDSPAAADPDELAAAAAAGPPDPRLARAAGLRHRLDLAAPTHPHRAGWLEELAGLERDLAARPPPRRPRPPRRPDLEVRRETLTRAELGPPSGLVREIGGGLRAVVHRPRPDDPDADLRRWAAALDVDALDRDATGPPPDP